MDARIKNFTDYKLILIDVLEIPFPPRTKCKVSHGCDLHGIGVGEVVEIGR